MIPIVPYEERFAEAVKDLLVSLQEYLVEIDPKQIQALPGSYREEYFRLTMASLAEQEGRLLLAIENGKPVGLIAGIIEAKDAVDRLTNRCPKRGLITELIVERAARGTGTGKALLREMEAYLKHMGCEAIAIDVFAPNQNAVEFYRRNGYEPRNIEVLKLIVTSKRRTV